MAKEQITRDDLINYEDTLQEIATRLRNLRHSMGENSDVSVEVNVGTLRYSISESDKYSRKMTEEYERFASQNEIRKRLGGKKTPAKTRR